MSSGFPPLPVYPYGIDSDQTLYLVYNTTEAPLTSNNEPWAEEIPVHPRKIGQMEIWADNGFGNISGELFYYDAVDKNGDGFVTTLKRCLRNLGGTKTQFNNAGVMVRSFVIAEHHNQIAETIFRVEDFVGENFSPEQATLDWRIRNLAATPIIFDDYDCPDVSFSFIILENDPAAGILVSYNISIVGTYTNFTLDFGDGNTTRSVASGTHRYAPNASVDPIITISNDKCQIVQSPLQRTNTDTPQPPNDTEVINLPVPQCPDLGDIVVPSLSVPTQDIVMPPIVFPCLDVSPFPSTFFGPISVHIDGLNLPSEISLVLPSMGGLPSSIDFGPLPPLGPIEFGTLPPLGPIEFGGLPPLGPIEFGPLPPLGPILFGPIPQLGPIEIDPVNISPVNVNVDINISPVDVNISPVDVNVEVDISPVNVNVNWGSPPTVPVDWGSPPEIPVTFPGNMPCIPVCWGPTPTIPVNITVTCNCACCPSAARLNETEPEFVDSFNPFMTNGNKSWMDPSEQMEINYDFQGFPSIIEVIPPQIPAIQVVHDIPDKIELMMPSHTIIEYIGPPIPERIQITAPDEPMEVKITIPSSIELTHNLPVSIQLDAPLSLPDINVNVHTTIQVVGIPSTIELIHHLPDFIELKMPENPVVQMIAPAVPMSVVVTLDVMKESIADAIKGKDGLKCFALVPCGN